MEKPTYAYYKHKYYRFLLELSGKRFERHFNFYSFIDKRKSRIKHENNKYYLTSVNIDWRFSSPGNGVMTYLHSLDDRANNLKKSYMLQNVDFSEGDVVIDCGAAQGLFFLALQEAKIEYYGFEPSPVQFEDLSFNLAKKGHIQNKALWKNSNEEIDFYVNDWLNDSSAIKINKFDEIIKVKTMTLDEVIQKINKKIKLIKIEAEGAEPEVLYGLNEQINKVQYITIDAGPERNNETTIIDCLNYLKESSFELISFYQPRVGLLFENKIFDKELN